MLNAAFRTHAGRVRPHNEDAAVCNAEKGVFAVIDGMGGEAAGEVAAAMAAAAIEAVPDRRRLAGETVLADALRTARETVLEEAERNPACRAMGAVASALRFDDRGRAVAIAHVGDTRIWQVGQHGVRQLTTDHVADTVEPGRSKPAVTRDLGRRDMDDPWIETHRVPVNRGELLVLASDGLHDPVPEGELADELVRLWRARADADEVCSRLVALALARGGPDNVTVVAVRVGPFRRGSRPSLRRLDMPGSVVLLVVLLAMTIGVVQWRGGRWAATVPATVPRDMTLYRAPGYELTIPETTVGPGSTFTLRGTTVSGPRWTVRLAEGSRLVVDRAVVDVEGELRIYVGAGARLEVRDGRLDADSLLVEPVGDGATAILEHAAYPRNTTWAEGIDTKEDETRQLPALSTEAPTPPPPGAPPPDVEAEDPAPPAATAPVAPAP